MEAGADPFAIHEQCHTYLHVAAAFDLPRSIRALVARGVDVNMKVIICSLIIVIIDRFYIALFSALEQTHCARM